MDSNFTMNDFVICTGVDNEGYLTAVNFVSHQDKTEIFYGKRIRPVKIRSCVKSHEHLVTFKLICSEDVCDQLDKLDRIIKEESLTLDKEAIDIIAEAIYGTNNVIQPAKSILKAYIFNRRKARNDN